MPRPTAVIRRARRSSLLRMFRHPLIRPYLAAWIPLALVYTALFTAAGTPPGSAAQGAIASVLPPLALGLLVLRIPRHAPWRDDRRMRFFALHIALAAVYGVITTMAVSGLRMIHVLLTTGSFLRPDALMLAWQVLLGALLYLVIAAGAYAWENAQRLRVEAARAAQSEALRARAELAALRSQLNPHFLLNTLHAALGLVRRQPVLAEQALERLGEVLHYGLRMHRESLDLVVFADEWAFVRNYLEIEALRLETRLQLRMDADPEAMSCLVPPFVLQPLVENAILHAVAPRKEGGRVAITAQRTPTELRLEVCDDGPGMPATTWNRNGLGLKLLQERLALLYAGRARLDLQSADGGGLRATIGVPLHHDAVSEAE